jgi:transient receptor potential cation channel subfamily M protein 2
MTEQINDGRLAEEGKQAMLRDLLYWAVFTDQIDMVRVLILHIRPRICAALTCSAILKQRARKATTTDKRHFYKEQALDLETYATDCINACYLKSERKACEIMIREVPLFGKITCMQVNMFISLYSSSVRVFR